VLSTIQPTTALHVDGWYHAGNLHDCITTLDTSLSVCSGPAHLGRSCGSSWADTLAAQTHLDLPFVILTLRPDTPAATHSHAIVAVHLDVTGAGPDGYLLDSASPERVYPLAHPTVAHAFDADVCYLVPTDPAGREQPAAPAATRKRLLRAVSVVRADFPAAASLGGAPFPGAQLVMDDGFRRAPRALLLYAPLGITCERSSFLQVASKVGL
jgi:hypothetical protein